MSGSGNVTILSRLRIQPLPSLSSLYMLSSSIKGVVGYNDFTLGINLISPRTMATMNMLYRKKKGPTDILSFSALSKLENKNDKIINNIDKDLGDLHICPQLITKDASKASIDLETHWQRILIHGILHLIGYDHEKDDDFIKMRLEEERVYKILIKENKNHHLPRLFNIQYL
jgi:rRNA maturation RNase YbeY